LKTSTIVISASGVRRQAEIAHQNAGRLTPRHR
jgi:hypothetical protein